MHNCLEYNKAREEHLNWLQLRLVARLGTPAGATASVCALYTQVLQEVTTLVLDDSASDAAVVEHLGLDSEELTSIVQTAEDMASTLLSLHASLTAPRAALFSIFGEPSYCRLIQFLADSLLAGGAPPQPQLKYLFGQGDHKDRYKENEINKIRGFSIVAAEGLSSPERARDTSPVRGILESVNKTNGI